jgi:hypothetical protein
VAHFFRSVLLPNSFRSAWQTTALKVFFSWQAFLEIAFFSGAGSITFADMR